MGKTGSARSVAMFLWVNFLMCFKEFVDDFAMISSTFIKCDIKAAGRLFLGRSMEPHLYIGVIMTLLRSNGVSPLLREDFYSSWRG